MARVARSVSPLLIAGISPDGPPHLDAGALVRWRETVLAMNGLGILARADACLLEGFGLNMTRARTAGRDIRERGVVLTETVTARNGDVRERTTTNPLLRVERDALASMRLSADALGLTPMSRARLRAAGLIPETPAHDLPGLGELAAMRPTAAAASLEPSD